MLCSPYFVIVLFILLVFLSMKYYSIRYRFNKNKHQLVKHQTLDLVIKNLIKVTMKLNYLISYSFTALASSSFK